MTTRTDILQIKLETDGEGKVIASLSGVGDGFEVVDQQAKKAFNSSVAVSGGLGKVDKEAAKASKSTSYLSSSLQGYRKAAKNIDDVGGKAEKTTKSLYSAADAAKTLAAGFAIYKTAEIVSGLVSINEEFDRLNASLVTVTGSEAAAESAFDRIQDFAAQTPYQLDEVTGAFIKLKALGLDPSEAALRSYGNTASAMGKSLNDMIEAVADATTGEFERLKEFGIKASVQGDQVRLRFRGITTTIGNNAQEIETYLRNIGQVEFAGGMERQMDTLGGVFSNLEDSTARLARTIGEGSGFNAALKSATRELTDFIDTMAEAMGEDGAAPSGNWLDTQTAKMYRLSERLQEAQRELQETQLEGPNITDAIGLTSFEERLAAAKAKVAGTQAMLLAMSRQANELAETTPIPKTEEEDGSAPAITPKIDTSGWAQAEAVVRSLYTAEDELNDEIIRQNALWNEGKLPTEDYGKAIEAAKKNYDEATDSGSGYLDLMADMEQVMRNTRTPAEEFADEITRLNGLFHAGLDVESYGQAILNAQQRFIEQSQGQADEWADVWTSAGNRFAAGIGDAVASAVVEQDNLADAMRAVLRGVLHQVISTLVEIGVKKVALHVIDQSGLAATTAATVASGATIAAAMAPAAAATSLATAGANSVPAAAGITSTYALTESLSLAGVAHDGLDYVPREGTYLLQKGEMVLNEGNAAAMRDAAKSGGGGQIPVVVKMPIYINAVDAQGIDRVIRSRRTMIEGMAVRGVRQAMEARGQRSPV